MAKQQVTIPVFIPHMGCPHDCAFCNQWAVSGEKHLPSTEEVQARIEEYIPHIKKSVTRVELAFFGGSFTGIETGIQSSLLEAVTPYLRRGLIHGIRLSTRPDYIDREILRLLESFNVSTIELGAQSFNDDVLKAANRGHTAQDIVSASRMIKAGGFELVIQLMPGLPEDTFERTIDSARAAAELEPEAVRIYPTVVMARTALETLYRQGKYTPLTMEEAVERVKRMYLLFRERNISVIRMGLHPLVPGEADSIIAGPYHPSFGFKVKARIRRDDLENMIREALYRQDEKGRHSLLATIPSKNSGEFIGHRAENIAYLKELFNLERLEYRIDRQPFPTVASL